MQGAALGPLARVPSIPLFYCMPDDSGNAPSQNQLGQLHPCDAEEYPADRSNPPVEHRREASRICCIESHHRLRPRAMNPQAIRQRIVCRTPASFCCGHVPHRPAPPQTAWNPLFRVQHQDTQLCTRYCIMGRGLSCWLFRFALHRAGISLSRRSFLLQLSHARHPASLLIACSQQGREQRPRSGGYINHL